MELNVVAAVRAGLVVSALFSAAGALPAFAGDSSGVVGSCADMRGSVHSCTAYSGTAFAKIPGAVADQKSACRSNPNQTWSENPCPATKALAHCLQDASVMSGGQGSFFIDTSYYAPLPAGVSLNAFRNACEQGNPRGVWKTLP